MEKYIKPNIEIIDVKCEDILLISKLEQDIVFDGNNVDETFGWGD